MEHLFGPYAPARRSKLLVAHLPEAPNPQGGTSFRVPPYTGFPTVTGLGFDPIWFGVVTVIMMEMGQISPPVGMNVFVISGVAADVPMVKIFKGILPFIAAQVLLIIILTIFPGIALYLPNAMDVLPSIGK